jgi:uncharacterized protein (DUF779 family)
MHPDVLPDGEFLVGDVDVLLGVIEGCPFYIDACLHEAWRRAPILQDVEAGFCGRVLARRGATVSVSRCASRDR